MTADNGKPPLHNIFCFLLSPEDSEHLPICLWADVHRQSFSEYCKTAFWLIVSVLISLGISLLC
ncbi:MAG: hypothetical protein R2941_05275 [Desulfobacterales bacterium]